MGIFTNAIQKRYSLKDFDRDMDMMVYGRDTMTGVKVSPRTALQNVPYFHGVRLIADTLAQVPLPYYRRVRRGLKGERGGKERAVEEILYWLLHDEPNPEMDIVSFKSALTGHALTWESAYAEIEWDMEEGVPKALWPLDPSRMEVDRDPKTRELVFLYTTPDGITHVLPAWRVLTIPGFGYNGISGYNNINQSREALGLTMALEEDSARFYGNSSVPDLVITHPQHLEKPAKENIKKSWQEAYGGLSRIHHTAILDEGITVKEVGIDPQKAQHLESRTFQIQEVSRMLNITPNKLMELSHATYSNIEQQDLEFVKYTMGIWFRRWEANCNRKLILPSDRPLYFYEFLQESLLRADSAARANFYRELFYLGALSPNDIREKENQNPIDNPMAEEYFVQRNMVPLSMAADPGVISGGRNIDRAGSSDGAAREEIVRRIALREKEAIQRNAYKFSQDEFRTWKDDFYRDFPEFIKRQVRPWLGDRAGAVEDFTRRWVRNSRDMLGELNPGDEELGKVMADWDQMKAEEI